MGAAELWVGKALEKGIVDGVPRWGAGHCAAPYHPWGTRGPPAFHWRGQVAEAGQQF